VSPNRLAQETSPYLRQHADNPVDWYPWGDEAFERAQLEDKPIFLSIGYSACHWCHVMAHESFEDPVTAAELNASFVAVKVDREERPDVDAVYMEAVQSLTGSGGWPMSMFLTPDRRPFFGGTYFPPADRAGTPSFRTVLAALGDVWEHRRDEVEEQADELSEAIRSRSVIPPQVGDLPATTRSPTCSPWRWPRWPAGSTPSGAGSVVRRSSPNRRWSIWPCATPAPIRRNRTGGGRSRWPP
jgi:hypothetical protein